MSDLGIGKCANGTRIIVMREKQGGEVEVIGTKKPNYKP